MFLNAITLSERLNHDNEESVLVYNDAQPGTGVNIDDEDFFDDDDDVLTENVPDPTCCSDPDHLCSKCKRKQNNMMDAMPYDQQRERGMRKPRKISRDAMSYEDQRSEQFPTLNLAYLIENGSTDPNDVLGLPTLNFANPFDETSSEEPHRTDGNLVNNAAPFDGIGVPQLSFDSPFA